MNDMTKSASEWDPIECSSADFQIAFTIVGRPYVRCYSTSDVPLPTLIPYDAPNRRHNVFFLNTNLNINNTFKSQLYNGNGEICHYRFGKWTSGNT